MAVSAVIAVAAAVTAYTGYEAHQDAKASRKQAEDAAAAQRESLAALQAEPVAAIPIADEKAKSARRRSIADQLRRRGRASTILTSNTGPTDALGG